MLGNGYAISEGSISDSPGGQRFDYLRPELFEVVEELNVFHIVQKDIFIDTTFYVTSEGNVLRCSIHHAATRAGPRERE